MKSARILFIAATMFLAAAPPAEDLSKFFPLTNRGEVNQQPAFPKGGATAHYKIGKKEYDLFLVKTKSNEAAALLSFDFKSKLKDPKFVPSFGGYYGLDGDKKIFVFPKLAYVGGVIGLTEKEADPIARDFASRIR